MRQRKVHSCRHAGVLTWSAVGGFVAIAFLAQSCPTMVTAEPPAAHLIRVAVPIEGSVDEVVRRSVRRLIADQPAADQRPVLVLEFWPPQDEELGLGSEFERSLALARFLVSKELNSFRTVAYVPRTVMGHAVLPILACEEIVMRPDALLGAAGRGESDPSPMMRGFYDDIANRRRTVPSSVALGMLDRDLEILRATTPKGVRYVLRAELDALKKETNVQEIETVAAEGDFVRLTGTEMRLTYGFASHLASDRRELSVELGVPTGSLEPDPSAGREWKSVRVNLTGPITKTLTDRVLRTIEEQLKSKVNLICLWIDSPGGSPTDSMDLADYLSKLDTSKVRTVAYVANEALADAALVAIACDQLVMENSGEIGGPGAYQPSDEEVADLRIPIRKICQDKSRHWSLPTALIDPDLQVFRYTQAGTDVTDHFSEEEWEELSDPDRWQRGEPVTSEDEPLQLTGERAASLGLAKFSVTDYEAFKRLYDLEDDPELVEPSWADNLIAYLAQPHVAATLLFFGGFALMVELSSPGIGAGGFVCVVCLVLFFWSQFLHGTASWLELLLFVTGVFCIVLEVFVIPGFGIFGVGGAALVVASLVLASQTFVIPQNEYQFHQLPRSLLIVAGACTGVLVGLFVLRKYMDRAPFLNRVMLRPPDREAQSDLARRESIVNFDHFVGQVGVTTTPLIPAGKARFCDEILSVVSDGHAVPNGADVQVDEVMGNKIVVTEVQH